MKKPTKLEKWIDGIAMVADPCKIPMLQCKYYGGGIYWICGCKVEQIGR